MRFSLSLLAGLALLFAPLTADEPSASATASADERVILISIDGLMPSSYTSPTSPAVNLRKLAAEGIWSEGVVGVLPTVTYPSHTTLITGVDPAVHGIVDNRMFDPEDASRGAWFWYARDIKVPTLPMAARSRGLRAAAVTWPVTVGMDLDYVAPEYPRSRHVENLTLLRALSQPRHLLDSVEIARGKPFDWPQTDRDRTDITKFILKTYDPHVLLLHIIALDSAQHGQGIGSPKAIETLTEVDGYVGEILDQVKASGRPTHVAVVSDHGFLPLKTMLQPNAAFKQEGLITLNERGGVASWKAYYHSSGGSGFVYVKDPADRDRVRKILLGLKQDPANGIREIWTADDLAKRGAHPDAAFGLDVVDGFYTGGGDDVLLKPSTTKGGHGFGPDRTALHSSFIMTGPTVQRRGNVGVIRMTQIAPTLAKILGVSLSPDAAKPLALAGGAETSAGK
jgi:predicted AlkP superfamily pyrophosphatase or phosphodiesterase